MMLLPEDTFTQYFELDSSFNLLIKLLYIFSSEETKIYIPPWYKIWGQVPSASCWTCAFKYLRVFVSYVNGCRSYPWRHSIYMGFLLFGCGSVVALLCKRYIVSPAFCNEESD